MKQKQLSRRLSDIECRVVGRSKKFTAVGAIFSLVTGAVLFTLLYVPLSFFRRSGWGVDMFFHGGPENRSIIPYFTVFFGCWALAILLIKLQKLHVQRKARSLADIDMRRDSFLHTILRTVKVINIEGTSVCHV